MVDWLVFAQLALTRVEALTLASALLEEGFLRTVGLKSAEALRSGGLSEQFLDDSTALYSFVSTGARLPFRSHLAPRADAGVLIPVRQHEEEGQREGRDVAVGSGTKRQSDQERLPAQTGEPSAHWN